MIFKTFDSDIDKISAKWGVFGKSFYDFAEASRNRKIAIDELYTVGGMPLKDAKKQVGSFWSYLYPKIDIDSVLPKIDENEASNVLNIIKSIEDGTYAEAKSFQELYDTGDKTKQWIAKYAQETKGQIRSTEGVIKANQAARDAAIAHNAALKQQTLSAKAASVVMKALSVALNVGLMLVVSLAINNIIEGISELSEKLKEERNEFANTIEKNRENANQNLEAVRNEISANKEKIDNLKELRSKLDSAKNSQEKFYALSDEIYNATGYWVNGIKDISGAYETVADKIDLVIEKSEEFDRQNRAREKNELKNKIQNNVISVEDSDKNKLVYDFGNTILNNPNTINNLKFGFGKGNVYVDIDWLVKKYLEQQDIYAGGDAQISPQDYIDAIDKIINMSSDEFTSQFGLPELRDIINEYGAILSTDQLPESGSISAWFDDQVGNYLEYYNDIISQSKYFSQDEFKEIIGDAILNGGLTGDNIDEFGKTLEDISKIQPDDVENQFSSLWDKYYSTALEDQETVKEEIINEYKNFLKQNNINSELLIDFLSGLYFNAFNNYQEKVDQNINPVNTFQSAWKNPEFEKATEKLLELAKAGELTSITFNNSDYSEFLKATGLSAKEACDEILKLVTFTERLSDISSDLKGLEDVFNTVSEDGFAGIEELEKLEKFKGLDYFKEFELIVGDVNTTAKQKSDAFDKLVSDYLVAEDALKGLTDENKKFYISQLENMGIVNASAIVTERLEGEHQKLELQEEALAITADGINEASLNKIESFLNEADASNVARIQLLKLVEQEQIYSNQNLPIESKVENLAKLATSYGLASESIEYYNKLASLSPEEKLQRGIQFGAGDYKKLLDEITALLNADVEYDPDSEDKKKKNSSKSDSTFDWIEVRLNRISKATDKLKEKFEDTFTLKGTNKQFTKYLLGIHNEISANEKAISKYQEKFNSIGLPKKWVTKIKNGAYSINELDGDKDEKLIEQINNAQKWYDKIISCQETIESLNQEIESAEATRADKIIGYYNDEIEKINTLISRRESLVSIKETWGGSASKSDLTYQQKQQSKQVNTLISQNKALEKQRNAVRKGSDAWQKYTDEIQNHKDKIYEAIKSYADISKEIANLPLDKATKKIEKINNRLDILQAKYDVAGSYKTKNDNLNKQTQEALNTKNANQEAYIEAKANVRSKWNSSYIKTVLGNSENKGKKFGEFLSTKGLDITSEAYKATVDYNNALKAEQDASNEAQKSNAKYTKTLQDNTKAKYDNIAAEYASKLSVTQANTEYTKSIQELNKAQGKSDISNSAKELAEQGKQNLQDELDIIKQELNKYDISKIKSDYQNGKLSYEDYMSEMAYVRKLDSDANNKQVEILEAQREINEWDIKIKEQRVKDLTRVGEQLSNSESIKKANGLGLTKKEIQEQITNNTTTIATYKAINAGLIELQNNCEKGSELWQEYQDKIDGNEKSIADLIVQNEELSNSIDNIPVQVIEKLGKVLDLVKNKLSGIISLTEKHGNTPSLDTLKGLIQNSIQEANASLMLMDEAKNKINKNLRNGEWAKLTEKQVENVWKYINSGNTKGLKEYFNNILKIDPNTLDEFFDTINELSTATSDYFNEAVSAEDNLDKMFEGYINQLNDIKDHLNEINDAKQRAIELAKLEAALQAARDDKTLSVYREGIGFTYEADQTAIKEAQDNLDKFKFDELINSLDDLTKALEDMKNVYNIYNDDGTLKTDYQQIIQSIPDAIVEAIKGTELNIVVSSDGKLTFEATPYAKGTLSALGGLSLVGEKGAELRLLNQGDGIIPHDITKNLISLGTDPTKFILDGLSKINRNVDNVQTVVNLQMDNVSLPNIKSGEDADRLVNELSRIALDAAQFANKR